MPVAQACVCLHCGATMRSRRGLRAHVRKMHAKSGESRRDATPLGTGPVGGCVAVRQLSSSAPLASTALRVQGHGCVKSAHVRVVGMDPQSCRVVALPRFVSAMRTQGALCAPPAHVPATLLFARPSASEGHTSAVLDEGVSEMGLAKMSVSFLLNAA